MLVTLYRPTSRFRLRVLPRASTFPTAAIGALLVASMVAACGGGTAATTAASSGAVSPAASSAPASSPTNVTASAAVSTGTGAGSGANPSDPCSVVTKADVEAAFGGSSTAGTIDENGKCAFEVSGAIHAGPKPVVPGSVAVSFGDTFDSYDRAKVVFGDAITKVDGLGTDAWYGLTAVHAKVAGGELVVAGFWVGTFNRDTLRADTITLTKAILGHL
jgi:hypothetical protein